jgi:hypothetical protein
VIEGVTFFGLILDGSCTNVRSNHLQNDAKITSIVAHVKGLIGANINFWD